MAPLTLYYASGSPFAWRVWLALEHKGIPYELKRMSFDAGDLGKPDFAALNPRRRVPVIVDGAFTLCESAAIVEYLDEKQPDENRVFAADLRQRAQQRRMIREADAYVAPLVEHLADAVLESPPRSGAEARIAEAAAALKKELSFWEAALTGDYLTGALSAADLTLYPMLALAQRFARRKPGLVAEDLIGARVRGWMARMESLPITQKTWPPHWK